MLRERTITEEQLSAFAESGFLFAILDSCALPGTVNKAKELGEERAISLFNQTTLEDYYAVAPYLFKVDQSTVQWISDISGEAASILIFAKPVFQELLPHLQHFLMVSLPDKRRWFFRYYDPRILRAYLPSCQPAELHQFYGPIRAFGFREINERSVHLFEHEPSPESAPIRYDQLWTIRPEQYKLFGGVATENFVDRIEGHLSERFSDLVVKLGPAKTRELVLSGINRARAYHLNSEQQVCTYIDLVFTFGPDFDERQPWAAVILKDAELSAETKALRLKGFIVE